MTQYDVRQIVWRDPDRAVLILEDDGGPTFKGVTLAVEWFPRDTILFESQPDWWMLRVAQEEAAKPDS